MESKLLIQKIYNLLIWDPKLQEGTSPMVKLMNGKATRDFKNYSASRYHFRRISKRARSNIDRNTNSC